MTTVWPFATNQELLNRALIATGDPEGYALTLLGALVKSGVAPEEMKEFAIFVREDSPAKCRKSAPTLRLVGVEPLPRSAARDGKVVA